MRSLVASLSIALLTASLFGCGSVPGAATPVARPGASAQSLFRHGMGYAWERYKTKQAPFAHPTSYVTQGLLPSGADLRAHCPAVYDQGTLSSCTAFAMAKGLREYMAMNDGESYVPLSALFHYYEERVKENTVNTDSGATITDGMGVLLNEGVAPDSLWSYGWSAVFRFSEKPPQAAYNAAPTYKVHGTIQLVGLDDVRAALANGQPAAFGFEVHESFMNIGADGKMPIPKAGEKIVGAHAVLAVGYDDARQVLICRNSWGSGWGDRGYFYMPYVYFADKNNADDIWIAQ